MKRWGYQGYLGYHKSEYKYSREVPVHGYQGYYQGYDGYFYIYIYKVLLCHSSKVTEPLPSKSISVNNNLAVSLVMFV